MDDNVSDLIKKYFGEFAQAIIDLLDGLSLGEIHQLVTEANAMEKARTAYRTERALQMDKRKAAHNKTHAVITSCNPHYTMNRKAEHRPRDLIQDQARKRKAEEVPS